MTSQPHKKIDYIAAVLLPMRSMRSMDHVLCRAPSVVSTHAFEIKSIHLACLCLHLSCVFVEQQYKSGPLMPVRIDSIVDSLA